MSNAREFHIPTEAERRASERSRELYAQSTEARESGDLARADHLLRQALKAGEGSHDAFHSRFLEGRLGDLLLERGDGIQARAVLEASVAAGSDIPATLGMLALLYIVTDDYSAFERLMRERFATEIVSAVAPDYRGASWLISLARRTSSLAEAGIDDQRPVSEAERIAAKLGASRELVMVLAHQRGVSAEALGDDARAIAMYRSLVLEDGSRSPATIDRLFLLLERAGRVDEALSIAQALLKEHAASDVRLALEARVSRFAKAAAKTARPAKPRTRSLASSAFGRRAAASLTAGGLLALEREEGRAERFARLDEITARVVASTLLGDDLRLAPADESFVEERFNRKAIEQRGTWSLKDHENAATEIYDASVVGPLLKALRRPLELRETSRGLTREQQKVEWQGIADFFEALGLDPRIGLDSMSYGGGWSKLTAEQRRETRQRLIAGLVSWAPESTARFRAITLLRLVHAYYGKADDDGRALRVKVVTATLRLALVGYFGGDWLAFLDYLGEKPHPAEQVVTALPEARILTAGSAKIAAAARELGLPPEQAGMIAASLWGTAGESPVEARVAALQAYWATFDEIHERQAKGMPSLWGLVEEEWDLTTLNEGPGEHTSGLFQRLLPPAIRAEIERLWDGMMLPRWPDRIVSPVSPHLLAADTIGPALKFWHGVGLTAWFVCEGPMSRTSIEDMETYYARDLEALEVAGAPIDRAVFRELLGAKRHLRERPRRYEESQQVEVAPGLSITIQTSFGATQYDGFEHLRDVITKFRRAWANAFLERYIRGRWDGEVRAAADVYNRVTNDAGKPPTARTLAPKVQATVNHWFGGDLAAFYVAIGAKAQIVTSRAVRFVPADRYAFMRAFVTAIRPSLVHDVTDPKAGDAGWELNTGISSLARLAFRSLQMTEALGEPPALAALRDQFSNAQTIRLRNEDYRPVSILGDDPELAWSRFQTAIGDALRSLSDSGQVCNPTPELAVTSKDDRSIAAQPMAPAPPAPEHAVGRLRRLLGLGGR